MNSTIEQITLNCPLCGKPVTLPNDVEAVNKFVKVGCQDCRDKKGKR
jgi:endogenous inhibitor of DNA gyrase (YacG/DUF329 family)